MKVPLVIVTVVAALAVVASAALAAGSKVEPGGPSLALSGLAGLGNDVRRPTATPAKTKVIVKWRTRYVTRIVYVYVGVPTQPVQPVEPAPADECAYSGSNCTDQQLCEIWGMHCDLQTVPPATSTDGEPAPQDAGAQTG
jgi:hypothetical protein